MTIHANPSLPVTPQQIKAIKMSQRALGLDDDTYHEMLRTRYRVESCTRLNRAQAAELLDHFRDAGFQVKRPPRIRRGPGVVVLATKRQLAYIGHLVQEVAWRTEDGYERWLHASLGMTRVRTREEAAKVIEGLKGLKRHGAAA